MFVRGIRGAISASKNNSKAISDATKELLQEIMVKNPTLKIEDIVSCIFTTTEDLRTIPPAQTAREIGWINVPMICVQEMSVQGSLTHVIRVLIHWNTDLNQAEVNHVYLGKAKSLRSDLASFSI